MALRIKPKSLTQVFRLSLGLLLSSCLSTLYPHCPCFCFWNTQISFSLQDLCTYHSPCLELFPPDLMAGPSSMVSAWMVLFQAGLPWPPHYPSALMSPSWVPRPCVLVIPHSPWSSLKSFGFFIRFSLSIAPSPARSMNSVRDSCGFAFLGCHLALENRAVPGAP